MCTPQNVFVHIAVSVPPFVPIVEVAVDPMLLVVLVEVVRLVITWLWLLLSGYE